MARAHLRVAELRLVASDDAFTWFGMRCAAMQFAFDPIGLERRALAKRVVTSAFDSPLHLMEDPSVWSERG
jgi:hypothetical protein